MCKNKSITSQKYALNPAQELPNKRELIMIIVQPARLICRNVKFPTKS